MLDIPMAYGPSSVSGYVPLTWPPYSMVIQRQHGCSSHPVNIAMLGTIISWAIKNV
jgi:hypothetical protein